MGDEMGALGQALASALTSSFFLRFELSEYEPPKAIGNGRNWHGFHLGESRFQSLVTLNLETNAAGFIDCLTLCLDRAILSQPTDRSFARDIAESFLTWALPVDDRLSVAELVAEIGDISRYGSIVSPHAEISRSDLPHFPSPGYRVFLGYESEFEQELAGSRLRIVNLNWSRRHVEMLTPPGYDGETMWMWLIVRPRR